jgi:hypothetical protein
MSFPVMVEATSAGVAAGLIANGSLRADEAGERCKLVHVRTLRWHDIGVIDAVLLLRDHTGNLLPYDPDRISALVLTRAEPAAVGMSPIGGYLDPVGLADDCGLALALRRGPGRARAHFAGAVSHGAGRLLRTSGVRPRVSVRRAGRRRLRWRPRSRTRSE